MTKEYPFSSSKWIWSNNYPEDNNQYGLFRRTICLPENPGEVKIYACADMRYWLYVNGERVGFGPGKYNQRYPQYNCHAVTRLMKPGQNIIAFKVHGTGAVIQCSSFMPSRCALIAAIEWEGELIGTDNSWRTVNYDAYSKDTPRSSSHQSFIECFDGRRLIKNWETEKYDDSAWNCAYEIPDGDLLPWEKLVPGDIANLTLIPRLPVRIIESGISTFAEKCDLNDMGSIGEMLSCSIRSPLPSTDLTVAASSDLFPLTICSRPDSDDGTYIVIDFGENSAGYLSFDIEGDAGTIIDLGYGEDFRKGVIKCVSQGVRYHDRIILGSERFEHQFILPKCLRYLLLEVRHGKAVFHGVKQDVSTYPVSWQGNFTCCEDEELNQIWRIGAHTVQLCMEDVYIDTPRRERAGWLGDMLPEAIAAYYAFGETEVARHSLDLFMSSQTKEGWIAGRYPSLPATFNMPCWSASYNMALADYIKYSGNLELAEKVWPGIQKLTTWFERQRTADGLMIVKPAKANEATANSNGYILVDWAPMLREGAISAMNMFYYRYLRDGAWIAGLMGKTAEAEKLTGLAERSRSAIQRLLFDEKRGIFVNCRHNGRLSDQAGCQENLLALLWDIASSDQSEKIVSQILKDDKPLPLWYNHDPNNWRALGSGEILWQEDGLVPMGSPFFAYFALNAMFEIGRTTAALNNIRSYYAKLLASGATTVWEEWSGVSSQSHGWGAGPTSLLSRYVLGVEPLEPGFKTFGVFPSFGDLNRVTGRVPTPGGCIKVEWEKDNKKILLLVVVPEGLSALAGLPVLKQKPDLLCNGKTCKTEFITLRRGKYIACKLESGSYQLEISI